MIKCYDDFVASINQNNTKKVVKSLADIGKYDYSNCTIVDIEQIILNMKPSSPKAIITICYVMTLYAKFLQNGNMLHIVESIDRWALWLRAKPNASRKFISYSDYQNVCSEIETHEIYNTIYYKTLFRSIYEGIYNNDLSVVKNLRSSDCCNGMVVLHDDSGFSYEVEVTKDLCQLLKELAQINTWERNARYGSIELTIVGEYDDSCFKTENRGGSKDFNRYTYYRMLRKLSVEYIGFNLLPQQLFISGIMHRIKLQLNKNNITLSEAFEKENRNRQVSVIIENELKRLNYDINVRNFREIVKGHLDVFDS